jgi:hypothetical protein
MSKAVSVKIEGSKLVLAVDPNGDGESVVEVKVELVEVLDELGGLVGKKEEVK